MTRRSVLAAALLALTISSGVPARADDAAEIAAWTSLMANQTEAGFRAYLETYPNGRFAALARIRLKALQGGAKPTLDPPKTATPTTTTPAVKAAAALPAGKVKVDRSVYRAIDRIEVEVDARPLMRGSQHRVAAFPVGTPDEITDPNELARISSPVAATSRQRLTIRPAPSGRNEVRLLYIPPFETRFVVAARAPFEVEGGYPGAILASDLVEEAGELGPVRFEAKYRDLPIAISGQFLRIRSETRTIRWEDILRWEYDGDKNYVELYVGQLGTEAPTFGGKPTEVMCLMLAEDHEVVKRLATLNPGDAVNLKGYATTWAHGSLDQAVIFERCEFAD